MLVRRRATRAGARPSKSLPFVERTGVEILEGVLAGGVLYYHGMALAADCLALDCQHERQPAVPLVRGLGDGRAGVEPRRFQQEPGATPKSCESSVPSKFLRCPGQERIDNSGRLLNGRTYDDMPERIVAAIPPRKPRLSSAEEWNRKAGSWQSDLVRLPVAACS